MRRSCPQMPIIKYMGISGGVSSQNRKKRNRSSETKTPIMAVSITKKMAMKNPFTFSRIDSQEHRIEIGGKKSGKQDQEQADAIDAEMVV